MLLSTMNKKQRKTLEAIFASPTPKTLPFSEMESLFRAIGCEVIEGDGSRVAFRLSGARVAFHRPHPRKEAQEYQVRAARDFFGALGIYPEDRNMNTNPFTYKGYTPLMTPENGGWNGRIAGIQAIETFEGPSYEAAIEDFKRAVDFYLETEENPENPFSGRISFQVAPEIHAELFRKAQRAGADDFGNWLAQELKESVLHA